jgi:hypothetical protein
MGSITTDRNAAVAGWLGRRARMIPVSVRVASQSHGRPRSESYRMQMADHRVLAPFLAQMAVYSALDATERAVGSATVSVEAEIRLAGGLRPIEIRNCFAGDFAPALPAALAVAQPMAALLESGLPGLQVDGIDVKLGVENRRRHLRLDQAWLSRKEGKAGDEVEVHLSLLGDQGIETRRSLRYRIPAGLEPGTVQIAVLDAGAANLHEARLLYAGGSLSGKAAPDFIAALNRLKRNSVLTLRLSRNDPTYVAGSSELAGLPASAALVFAKSPLGGSSLLATGGARLGEAELDLGEWVVSGSKSLTFTIH